MNGKAEFDSERRAALVSALSTRGRLLRLPEELVSRALRRCVPRGDAPKAFTPTATTPFATTPNSERFSAVTPAVTPLPSSPVTPINPSSPSVPTHVATALTEMSEGIGSLITPITVAKSSSTAVPDTIVDAKTDANNDALTPQSLARLNGESGQWDVIHEGAIIAGYRIERPLGAGAMGQVYRAVQLSMNRAVAFKVMSPKLASNRRFRERFVREARAAGRLHHPNLIAVHDVGEADGLMFFSMELVEGTSVSELLRQHGRIPEMRALEICRQVLEALKFAHAAGVIHRDIKPDNLMVTKSGMVKVADLGLARAEDAEDASVTATNVGAVMGTPHYMAPEQGRDAHSVDHRADLYAVGATLYHLICGHTPFNGEGAMEVLMRAASQPLKFPEPGPSPAVQVLISRLMEKDAKDRPQSASEVIEMISKLRRKQVDDNPGHAPNSAEAVVRARQRRLRRTMRRISWYAFGLSVAVVAIILISGLAGGWQWNRVQSQVATLTKQNHYREAIELLERQPVGLSSPEKDIARVRAEVERAWDSWAYLQVQTTLKKILEQLNQHHLSDAYNTLQLVSDEVKSPAVRKDFDSYQRQWEEAVLAEDAAKPMSKEDIMREVFTPDYIKRITVDMMKLFAFNGPGKAVVSENMVRFTGAGNGRGDVFTKLAGRVLNLSVKFLGKEHGLDQWALPLAEGRTLVVSAANGIVLTGLPEGDRTLAKSSDQYNIMLHFDAQTVDILIRDGLKEVPNKKQTIGKPNKEFTMAWDAGVGHSIDVRFSALPYGGRRLLK
jgi:Protein kinase domain